MHTKNSLERDKVLDLRYVNLEFCNRFSLHFLKLITLVIKHDQNLIIFRLLNLFLSS